MRTLRPSAGAFAVATLAFLFGAVAWAHHSRAGYDTAKERLTTQNGVVSEVIWRNPHVYLVWDAKDDKKAPSCTGWVNSLEPSTSFFPDGMAEDRRSRVESSHDCRVFRPPDSADVRLRRCA